MDAYIDLKHCKHAYGEMYSVEDLDENGEPTGSGAYRIGGINPVSLSQNSRSINTTAFPTSNIAIQVGKKWVRLDLYIKELKRKARKK